MKTSIDLPDELLAELKKNTKSKTIKLAIITAITEYNQRFRMQKLAGQLGKFENFLSPEKLKQMRED